MVLIQLNCRPPVLLSEQGLEMLGCASMRCWLLCIQRVKRVKEKPNHLYLGGLQVVE